MFEDVLNELKKMHEVSTEIDVDSNGYIDKQCPSEPCEFLFKVYESDWIDKFQDEAVWCPFCRHEATSDQWFTLEQVEHAKSEALEVAIGTLNNAFDKSAKKFNQRQPKNSLITMSMKFTGTKQRTHTIPAKAAEAMALKIQCSECDSRFSVVGSAYFCPCCGYNSVIQTFQNSLRKIQAKKESVDISREILAEKLDKDQAELTCRSMVETCIPDAVVAFQKFCEGLYEPFGKAKFNIFQRLFDGSKLWKETIGVGYDSWLNPTELQELLVLFQKRHILSHNEGIVDQQYLDKSGDTKYKLGQRIVVSNDDIDNVIKYVEILALNLKSKCDAL